MKTIILPGYSHKNKEWAEEVAKNIPDSEVYEWKHWSDLNVKFSAKEEAENVRKIITAGDTSIIAKSIGTLVAVMTLKNIKVNKVVFCGVPVNDINDDEKYEYKILADFPAEKIIVFQNSEDEHGKFEEVRNFLSQINPLIKIVEKPGGTHDYPYYEGFKEFLI